MFNEKYSTTRLLIEADSEVIANEVKQSNMPEDKFETVLFLPMGENRKGEGGLRTKGYFKKSYEDKLLISIVTVVYNGEKYLEETIQSVINQTYDNVEYIIIDGGSIDGTLDIIKKYEDQIDYWVSEKDKGIYDALHKGFSCASGEIFAWLNADDIYYPWTLKTVVNILLENKNIDWITGVPTQINEDSDMINVGHPKYYFQYFLKQGYYRGDFFGFIQQESTFFRKDLYSKTLLDRSLKLAGDYKLWIDFAHFAHLYTVKVVFSSFRIHGNQKSSDINKYYNECDKANNRLKFKFIKYLFKPLGILLNNQLINIKK